MSVYVDDQKNEFKGMKMCHMLADSLEELHQMAQLVGLKIEWFHNGSTPHYDLSQTKRELAVKNGAIEIDRYEVVRLIKEWRGK